MAVLLQCGSNGFWEWSKSLCKSFQYPLTLTPFQAKETVTTHQGLTKNQPEQKDVQVHLTSTADWGNYSAECSSLQYQTKMRLGGPQSQSWKGAEENDP
jgi:hypothetical protein